MSEEQFWNKINEHGIFCDRITTYKGFYSSTLTPELVGKFLCEGRRALFVNVDCDFYESAVPVFQGHLPNTKQNRVGNLFPIEMSVLSLNLISFTDSERTKRSEEIEKEE